MDLAGKRLLIIGAGRGQLGLYKAAKAMGITTIAGTMPDNNPPGIDLADEVCYMDITKPDEVVEKARQLKLDGAATCCLDTGIPALGKVCDSLKLTGLTQSSAFMCGDKLKMKKAFVNHDVSTAKFYEIFSEEELNKALEKLSLPVIIKATDLQGSKGIYISRTREAAHRGFHQAMELTKQKYCIVEEYIDGREFGAQAFVYGGEILFIMPHGDETYMSHTAVPVGHYVPLDCSEDIIRQIEIVTRNAIRALGLDNCAVNIDLVLKDGIVYVIELTGRMGANALPELVEINFGIEYYKMAAAMAVGGNPLEFWNKRRGSKAGLAKMILETEKSGVLEKIEYRGNITDNIIELAFFKHPGDEIRMFENSNDCIGQIVIQGDSLDDCRVNIDKLIKKLEVKLK